METILANSTGKVRRLTHKGRKTIVATAVLIVPGVLNGSQGPLYYPAEECAKNPGDWDGMPMVVYHPLVNGKPTSARVPEVLEKSGIGSVFHTDFDDKLSCHLYFDEKEVESVDPRILVSLNKNEKIELSTGVFTKNVMTPGKFNDIPYDGIATNYRPDHVAILPDQKGACGIEHGCGVLANDAAANSWLDGFKKFMTLGGLLGNPLTNAAMSHSDLRMQLSVLVEKKYGKLSVMGKMSGISTYEDYPYVVDVFDKYVVFRANGKVWKSAYTTDLRNNKVELSGEPVEVFKSSTYKVVTNESDISDIWTEVVKGRWNPKNGEWENDMNRDQKVEFLTANCGCWKHEGAKDDLGKLGDKAVDALYEKAKKEKETVQTNTSIGLPAAGSLYPGGVAVNAVAKPVTTDEYLNSAPPEIRELLNNARETERNEKAVLCNRLSEHLEDATARTQEATWLMNKPLSELRRLSALVPIKPKQTTNAQDDDLGDIPGLPCYAGAAVGNTSSSDRDEDLLMPVRNIDYTNPVSVTGLSTSDAGGGSAQAE